MTNITQLLNQNLDPNAIFPEIYNDVLFKEIYPLNINQLDDENQIICYFLDIILWSSKSTKNILQTEELQKFDKTLLEGTLIKFKHNIRNIHVKAIVCYTLTKNHIDSYDSSEQSCKLFLDISNKKYDQKKIDVDFLPDLEKNIVLALNVPHLQYQVQFKAFLLKLITQINDDDIVLRNAIYFLCEYKLEDLTSDDILLCENAFKRIIRASLKAENYQNAILTMYFIFQFVQYLGCNKKKDFAYVVDAHIHIKYIAFLMKTDNKQKFGLSYINCWDAIHSYTLVKIKSPTRLNRIHKLKIKLQHYAGNREMDSIQQEISPDPVLYNSILANVKQYSKDVVELIHQMTLVPLLTLEQLKGIISKTPTGIRDCIPNAHLRQDGKTSVNKSHTSEIEKIGRDLLPNALILNKMLIEPYRSHINGLNMQYNELEKLIIDSYLKNNQIVPQNSIKTIARAIMSGFQNDFISASYIIPALIERILREYLRLTMDYTWRQNSNSELDNTAYNINQFLGNKQYTTILKNRPYLGADILFYLDFLLISKIGINFRNDLYHGLYDDIIVTGLDYVPKNLWFLFIKIIVLGKEYSKK